MTPMWCDDPANLALLIRYLDVQGQLNGWRPDDYAYFLEKPHKWQQEYDELQAELALMEREQAA